MSFPFIVARDVYGDDWALMVKTAGIIFHTVRQMKTQAERLIGAIGATDGWQKYKFRMSEEYLEDGRARND